MYLKRDAMPRYFDCEPDGKVATTPKPRFAVQKITRKREINENVKNQFSNNEIKSDQINANNSRKISKRAKIDSNFMQTSKNESNVSNKNVNVDDSLNFSNDSNNTEVAVTNIFPIPNCRSMGISCKIEPIKYVEDKKCSPI